MKLVVKVKTNCKENKVELIDNVYTIHTKCPAKENKANLAVIDLLSEYFDIPKKDISIKSGLKSKKKTIEI